MTETNRNTVTPICTYTWHKDSLLFVLNKINIKPAHYSHYKTICENTVMPKHKRKNQVSLRQQRWTIYRKQERELRQSLSYSSIRRSSSSSKASEVVGWGWLAGRSPPGSWLFGSVGISLVSPGRVVWMPGSVLWVPASSWSLSRSSRPGSLSPSASSFNLNEFQT